MFAMPADNITAPSPSHLRFPHLPPPLYHCPSPRLSSLYSPRQASLNPPSLVPPTRKRSRLPTPESPNTPSDPSPLKRLRTMEGGAAISVLKVDISQEGPLSGTPALFSAGGINRKNSMGLSLKTGGDLDLAEDQPTARPVDMPPSPSSIGSPRSSPPRTYSPPRISQSMSTKRNPKRLSLSIPITEAGPSTSVAVGRSLTPPSDNDNTPYTPGPPQTPAMAMTLPRVRSRRPNLLSLITQPPTAYDVSLTPGGKPYPYATVGHPRRRSNTTDDPPAIGVDPRSSRSAYPRLNTLFPPIQETGPRVASPSSSSSRTASLSSTPSSSPPLPHLETPYSTYSSDPYANGPIEIIPGVYLGAEESMYAWSTWARSKRVRILNVAQEIEDPFSASGITPLSRKCKGKISRAVYPEDMQEGRPEVDYVHLAWSHGESGLAEMVEGMQLDDVIKGRFDGDEVEGKDQWKFWEAIRFMEYGRQRGEAVLIHCQCGVSRSATLVIAYTMALAAAGIVPEHLGHLKGMQNAYDFVKGKSNWIGPNVSLVFQLLEFSRNITTLLSSHLASHPGDKILTSWPSAEQAAQTEADWARQRAQFDQEPGTAADGPPEKDIGGLGGKLGEGIEEMTIDEEAIREAEVLDEAMRVRRLGREADK